MPRARSTRRSFDPGAGRRFPAGGGPDGAAAVAKAGTIGFVTATTTSVGPAPEIAHARAAGLRYVDDSTPGFGRKRIRGGFAYFDAAGRRITDEAELGRIKALAIPPAYEDVWICPSAHGHVQATARDARGRKQYRYHKRWREVRDANKYESTVAFANVLPALRLRVRHDLALPELGRERVLATVVTLLEATNIRVGNESYARENGSYGLTTLRSRHVRIEGEKCIRLKFRGKSGVEHSVAVEDRRLARTIARCRDLPGELLFNYIDGTGEAQPVHSDDVNGYLREITGGDFSAKDFRTWAATVACARELAAAGGAATVAEAKAKVNAACAATARILGNTPAVCRKSYVHPAVIETYLDHHELRLPSVRPKRGAGRAGALSADERRVLAFLEQAARRDRGSERVALLEKSIAAARRKRREGSRRAQQG